MKRLRKIASCVPRVPCVVDVGCDHGKLSRLLLDTGKAERVIATDLSVPSLAKARALADKHGLAMDCRAGNGLTVIKAGEAQCAVIAGMGGLEILSILSDPTRTDGIREFVLSPHTEQYALRKGLSALGLRIESECIVSESGKFYTVMRVCEGTQTLTEDELTFGLSIREPDGEVRAYLDDLAQIYQNKLDRFGDVPALRSAYEQVCRVRDGLDASKE